MFVSLTNIPKKQTGDPTGTGKGGNSIWGKKFNDEIRSTLKVTKMGLLLSLYSHYSSIMHAV
jgi:cyclophilin family peptidyl-prolyl cis-trans isomerase